MNIGELAASVRGVGPLGVDGSELHVWIDDKRQLRPDFDGALSFMVVEVDSEVRALFVALSRRAVIRADRNAPDWNE
jgi:hypothetical protein